jgi:uncharacterized repeat protein (TIGR01451 family)
LFYKERDVDMGKIYHLTLFALIVFVLSACGSGPTAAPTTRPADAILDIPIVGLIVQVQNAADVFNTVNQVIVYRHIVSNTGIVPLAGPVVVQDNKMTVICPEVNTVGNLDVFLDPNEELICTSSYPITQQDLNQGSVTNLSIATISGFSSPAVTTTVTLSQTNVLSLTKTANPTTFNQAGQVITYTFAIQNKGANTLGPTQFTITDDRLGPPFNCGVDGAILLPDETISCTANYTILQSDLNADAVINVATASGGGAVSAPAFFTITNNTIIPTTPPSSLTPGTTIQHIVEPGEWLIQIARCYGANHKEVIQANPHITNPSFILRGQVVTVPRIGSVGKVYGKPCVGSHTVQSGETWTSIAQRYNADVAVLQEANPRGMAVGTVLKIPLNSAGGTSASPLPNPPAPIRITFPVGTNSVVLGGTLSPTGRVRYVLNASQNQVLSVNVVGPANEVALAVLHSNETVIKPLDTTLTWNGAIPANGDYFIDIVSVLGAANKTFSMEVRLTGP